MSVKMDIVGFERLLTRSHGVLCDGKQKIDASPPVERLAGTVERRASCLPFILSTCSCATPRASRR